jgi:hypothetical protein
MTARERVDERERIVVLGDIVPCKPISGRMLYDFGYFPNKGVAHEFWREHHAAVLSGDERASITPFQIPTSLDFILTREDMGHLSKLDVIYDETHGREGIPNEKKWIGIIPYNKALATPAIEWKDGKYAAALKKWIWYFFNDSTEQEKELRQVHKKLKALGAQIISASQQPMYNGLESDMESNIRASGLDERTVKLFNSRPAQLVGAVVSGHHARETLRIGSGGVIETQIEKYGALLGSPRPTVQERQRYSKYMTSLREFLGNPNI